MTGQDSNDYSAACHWNGPAVLLRLHVQPGARTTGFAGMHGDRIKLRLSAPPVEGRANEYLREFLAGQFGVSKSVVTVESGASSRQKTVRIEAPTKLPAGFEGR